MTITSCVGYGRHEKETQIKNRDNTNKGKGRVGHNVNRCMESLHLNSDRDCKHLISYGRVFQYVGATTESRFRVRRKSRALHNFHRVTFPASSTKGMNTDQVC